MWVSSGARQGWTCVDLPPLGPWTLLLLLLLRPFRVVIWTKVCVYSNPNRTNEEQNANRVRLLSSISSLPSRRLIPSPSFGRAPDKERRPIPS